ncbi:MAG: CapA family protein [Leptospirales bacterium]|nr:CapA family protein [Leptospirales bacterium]
MFVKIPIKKKIRAVTFFVSAIAVMAVFLIFCDAKEKSGGPLLFQLHYTSPVNTLNISDAAKIFSGDSGYNIYVDVKIAAAFSAEYPSLVFKECDAVLNPPSSDRKALLISDLRGLVPTMKLASINECYPWGKLGNDWTLSASEYPLLKKYAEEWNDESHITIVQTGVTAMSRAFMKVVDGHGDLRRPVEKVMQITSAADIAMTSNEVSFTENCKFPLPNKMEFCSPMKYFDILRHANFKVIELTGNHNNDYGSAANTKTIDLYEKEGMKFFGGGRNKAEAEAVLYMKVKDTTFAFTGSNEWGPEMAWATEKRAGAAKLSAALFERTVKEAVNRADIVFVTVQWGNENDPKPYKQQIEYFRKAADLGAHIMVSSSSHRAMGLEFYKNRFISYGLGNFLFDQMHTINHRRGLIARHHFYGKRHIQTELIPYLMHRSSEPTPVKGKEAAELFDYVFKHSIGSAFK